MAGVASPYFGLTGVGACCGPHKRRQIEGGAPVARFVPSERGAPIRPEQAACPVGSAAMGPANVDPIGEEASEPAEADDPGLTQVQKDKALFEAGLTETLRGVYEQLAAELESLEAWADEHPEEVRACALLMDVLGIRGHREGGKPVYERVDDQSGNDLNDFDLHLPDGRRVAVEVTRDISQASRQYGKMVENEGGRLEGFPKVSEILAHHWRIDVEPAPTGKPVPAVRKLQDGIEAELRCAEELGEADPCFPTFPLLTRETSPEIDEKIRLRERLRKLGVRHANHADKWTDHDGPGKLITASVSGPHGFVGADSVNDPVERHLAANLKKLQPSIEAEGAEAHLFIWLVPGDPQSGAALAAAQSRAIAEVEPPDLRGVDSVWLAIDSTWMPIDLAREVADRIGGEMPRLPMLPVCRLTKEDGWKRYTCEWRPGAETRPAL